MHLEQRFGARFDVPYAESHGDGIGASFGQGHVPCVGDHDADAVFFVFFDLPLHAVAQHGFADVAGYDADAGIAAYQTERDIQRACRHVDYGIRRAGDNGLNEPPPPPAVDEKAEQPVLQIVPRRHASEHVADVLRMPVRREMIAHSCPSFCSGWRCPPRTV